MASFFFLKLFYFFDQFWLRNELLLLGNHFRAKINKRSAKKELQNAKVLSHSSNMQKRRKSKTYVFFSHLLQLENFQLKLKT